MIPRLHGAKLSGSRSGSCVYTGQHFLDPEHDLDCDMDNFAPCKRGIGLRKLTLPVSAFISMINIMKT